MARRKKQADVGVNMTPMIDIVFQLILFFMLASSYASAEIDKLVKVPVFDDKESQAKMEVPKWPHRVVLNLAAAHETSQDLGYIKVGAHSIGTDMEKLRNMLEMLRDRAREKEDDAKLVVIIRAHRTLRFAEVARVKMIAGSLGITDMQFATPVGEAGARLLMQQQGGQ